MLSSSQPEFLADRGLGKTVPARLADLGWIVHTCGEEFPNDAQSIEDADWMFFGLERGWFPLHKDGRIVSRDAERRPIETFGVPMFFLTNQQLAIDEMVHRIHTAQRAIYRRCASPVAAAFGINQHGRLERRWPRS